MDAAAELYRAGTRPASARSAETTARRGYDEPADMKAALLRLGVPADAMTLDDAGFRTLDSVVRARQVFGQQRLTIITDRFHCLPRRVPGAALAGSTPWRFPRARWTLRYSFKSRVREMLADVKACLDLYVLHTRPRFLGKPIAVRVAGR